MRAAHEAGPVHNHCNCDWVNTVLRDKRVPSTLSETERTNNKLCLCTVEHELQWNIIVLNHLGT